MIEQKIDLVRTQLNLLYSERQELETDVAFKTAKLNALNYTISYLVKDLNGLIKMRKQ